MTIIWLLASFFGGTFFGLLIGAMCNAAHAATLATEAEGREK